MQSNLNDTLEGTVYSQMWIEYRQRTIQTWYNAAGCTEVARHVLELFILSWENPE